MTVWKHRFRCWSVWSVTVGLCVGLVVYLAVWFGASSSAQVQGIWATSIDLAALVSKERGSWVLITCEDLGIHSRF